MAENEPNKRKHSERVSETASARQKEERERERSREKPDPPEGTGDKPHELRTTSKSEFDEQIEEKEGHQVQRTPEEMSLHEELSTAGEDEKKKKKKKKE